MILIHLLTDAALASTLFFQVLGMVRPFWIILANNDSDILVYFEAIECPAYCQDCCFLVSASVLRLFFRVSGSGPVCCLICVSQCVMQ